MALPISFSACHKKAGESSLSTLLDPPPTLFAHCIPQAAPSRWTASSQHTVSPPSASSASSFAFEAHDAHVGTRRPMTPPLSYLSPMQPRSHFSVAPECMLGVQQDTSHVPTGTTVRAFGHQLSRCPLTMPRSAQPFTNLYHAMLPPEILANINDGETTDQWPSRHDPRGPNCLIGRTSTAMVPYNSAVMLAPPLPPPSPPLQRVSLPEKPPSRGQTFQHSIVTLAQPFDEKHMTRVQVLLRRQIEVFVATPHHVNYHARGRNSPIRLGQVGLRCRHCATPMQAVVHSPLDQRGKKGSTYFPSSVKGFYQAGQNLSAHHLQNQTCTAIPVDIQAEFTAAAHAASKHNGKRTMSSAGRDYWAHSARSSLGLVDTDQGVFFMHHCPVDARVVEHPMVYAASSNSTRKRSRNVDDSGAEKEQSKL